MSLLLVIGVVREFVAGLCREAAAATNGGIQKVLWHGVHTRMAEEVFQDGNGSASDTWAVHVVHQDRIGKAKECLKKEGG